MNWLSNYDAHNSRLQAIRNCESTSEVVSFIEHMQRRFLARSIAVNWDDKTRLRRSTGHPGTGEGYLLPSDCEWNVPELSSSPLLHSLPLDDEPSVDNCEKAIEEKGCFFNPSDSKYSPPNEYLLSLELQ